MERKRVVATKGADPPLKWPRQQVMASGCSPWLLGWGWPWERWREADLGWSHQLRPWGVAEGKRRLCVHVGSGLSERDPGHHLRVSEDKGVTL